MLVTLLLLSAASAAAVTVDCDRGESLDRALAKLDKRSSQTVSVKGTCAEYVAVRGFENLTLKGLPGATLVKPADPPTALVNAVLLVDASRSVTVEGLKVQAPDVNPSTAGILIWNASTDIRLRNLTVEGGITGILVGKNCLVSIAGVTGRNPNWATVGIFELSHVQIEDCLFEGHTAPGFWNVGISVQSGSQLNLHGTTVRNMQVGIEAGTGGVVNVFDSNTYYPSGGPAEVLVESPLGTNFYGLLVSNGGAVEVSTAKLRITNAGQTWGGSSGAVVVKDGGTFNGGGNNLEVSGSKGQGVYVANNSHVTLAGASVTGGLHNGLVVVNLSTASVTQSFPAVPTQLGGNNAGGTNAKDIFCDSRSLVTGGSNIAGGANVQCGSLLADESEPIPH
jgi:hypothetical protein